MSAGESELSLSAKSDVGDAGAVSGPPGRFEPFRVRSFPQLWAAGSTWNVTRWMTIFLGSYMLNELTGSEFLTSLIGSFFFLPMFVGGLAAGAISDRFDRRRTVLTMLSILIPSSIVIAALVIAGVVQVWMVYLFVVIVGVGQVVDLTNRRALIHDVVGHRLIGTAMALEALSLSTGNTLGAVAGGAVIGLLGTGQGFGTMGLLWATSFLLIWSIRPPARDDATEPATMADILRDLVAGARSLPDNPPLVSLFGITAIMNLLFFAYFPLVPVVAERFDVGPFLTGLLASGHGIGMLVGSSSLVAANPAGRGRIYAIGSFGAMALLAAFVNMPSYPLALATMIVMGTFAAGFAATQSALVLHVSSDEMRGRAMGMLSMCIGALPFGMAAVGALAQTVGAARALSASSLAGLVLLSLWTWRHPEVLGVS